MEVRRRGRVEAFLRVGCALQPLELGLLVGGETGRRRIGLEGVGGGVADGAC